jgi:hypothetical protein
MGIARQLALDHLVHESVSFWAELDTSVLGDAIAHLGVGLDHFYGEQVVAMIDERPLGPKDVEPFRGALLTDRRLIAGSPARGIALETIRGAQLTGGRKVLLLSQTVGVGVELDAASELFSFVTALCQIPPEERVPSPRLLVQAPDGEEAMLLSGEYDRRPARILALVQAGNRAGIGLGTDATSDLVARVVLLDRTLARGRGMRDSFWLSPLPPSDLTHVLCTLLGPPCGEHHDSQGGLHLTFRPKQSSFKGEVELLVVPMGTLAGFSIQKNREEVKAIRFIHDALPQQEAYLLLLRALYGWNVSISALLDIPPRDVAARMKTLDGVADLGEFIGDATYDGHTPRKARELAAAAVRAQAEEHARARSAWRQAVESGDVQNMVDAAHRLRWAGLYTEAVEAYTDLGQRFPALAPTCAGAIGECHLSWAADQRGITPEQRLHSYDVAIQWFTSALHQGADSEEVEESFWTACEAAASEAGDVRIGSEYVELYQQTFPKGEYRHEASQLLQHLGGCARSPEPPR